MYLSEVNTLSRENNLNIIRLIAATSVTFGHSFAMFTGKHYEILPSINSAAFGFLAVAVFFGLSGFLIAQSFVQQKSWKTFLEARCLRIFPGLFFANLITVLLVSFIVKKQNLLGLMLDSENWNYLFYSTALRFHYYDNVFQGLPINGPNGSLWTLPIELRMYLFVLLVGLLGLLARRTWALCLALTFTICSILQIDFVAKYIFRVIFAIQTYDSTYLSLPFCFGIGMLAYLYREKFKLNFVVALLGVALVYFIDSWVFKVVAFVYASLVFGYHPKAYLPKLNFKNDISYGVYVLSWPIQQIFIYTQFAESPIALFCMSILSVVPVAFISWRYIEKPALRLKGKVIALPKYALTLLKSRQKNLL
ncbi:acyltransferase family protein [Bdellovibrio sp. HCB209]|uniref:acyltransferase family protein n=1 Tax=Bdellovibrio sp. HCB209 TaxID=3394354 RepID=UPI0039B68229